MKVILLNGSRREKGCTYTALSVVADTLKENGIDAEIVHALPDDATVDAVAEKMKAADGLVIGSTGLRRLVKSSPSWINWLVKPVLP